MSWFPHAAQPVAVVDPAPGGRVPPSGPIRLTLSETVKHALGSARPTLSPATPGKWSEPDSHTLRLHPVEHRVRPRLEAPRSCSRARSRSRVPAAARVRVTREIDWTVPAGSMLRLQQLLAEARLPARRRGRPPARPSSAPPRPRSTPRSPRRRAASPGATRTRRRSSARCGARARPNEITRGAVMAFQNRHGLAADGFAGRQTWAALLADAVAGKQRTDGYSLRLRAPQRAAAPQPLARREGRHPLARQHGRARRADPARDLPGVRAPRRRDHERHEPRRLALQRPGHQWISYFNGGDALHAFTRASFGTPQSLGCVELPLAAAAKVWPYTPIGTLVTIEN